MTADDTLATLAALLARVESLEITPLRTHGRSVAVRVQLANGKRRTLAEGPVEAMLAEALIWCEGEGDPLETVLAAEREKSARLAAALGRIVALTGAAHKIGWYEAVCEIKYDAQDAPAASAGDGGCDVE
jgi:hypothetical protein